MAALLASTAAVLLAANCPSPAQLDDLALSELSYKDLVASLRACAALAEQQQQLDDVRAQTAKRIQEEQEVEEVAVEQ